MALIAQDDSGTVPEANAYLTAEEFRAYHDARGNTYGERTDPEIEQAIVRATDYLDQRFRFVGKPLRGRNQTTAWPRRDARDCARSYIHGIPREVKAATAEYALRALEAPLNPDPTRDPTGALVASKSESVGPISESVTYVGGADLTLPAYPAADQMLKKACLTVAGGKILRG